MRAFLLFIGLMIAALAAIAVFTYPAWLLLHPHFNFPFHRLGERIGMLALLIGFLFVATRAALALKPCSVVGMRTARGSVGWSVPASLGVTALVQLVAPRLLSGIAVAFSEEAFLR